MDVDAHTHAALPAGSRRHLMIRFLDQHIAVVDVLSGSKSPVRLAQMLWKVNALPSQS